jgi:hypothetical protein
MHPIRKIASATVSVSVSAMMIGLLLAGCDNFDGGNGAPGPVIQVGDNLNFAPNNTWSCQDGFPIQINAAFPQPFHLAGLAGSCTLLTFFPGAQPTVPGTVVSAHINVGPVTGPMRFVRMRILVQNLISGPNKACCSVEQYGPVFTPQANGITTVPLNFPMTQDHPPAPSDLVTIAAGDLVGLEVLAPNVPIPGTWPNNGGMILTLPNYIWLPSLTSKFPNAPTQNLRSEGSFSGFLPAYNLNFQAAASSASPTAP